MSLLSLVGRSRLWPVFPVMIVVLLLGGCGGNSDLDAIEKAVDDRRQWEGATVSGCEEMRQGSDWGHGWPPTATFYACELRGLDELGLETLFLPEEPPQIVRVCFAVLHDQYEDVVVVGAAHDRGPCGQKRSA